MPLDTHQYIDLEGQVVEWTKYFKYLGSHIESSESGIKIRKGQALGAFWKIKDVFQSKSKIFPIRLKINIYQAACVYILLYGYESWIITENLRGSLNNYATNCYIIMLGIKRLDKIPNRNIYATVGQVQQR